jgi:hypothetical protein
VKRRLLNVLTALSLLLCVTVCAAWALSYWYYQGVRYGKGRFAVRVDSQQGLFRIDSTAQWPGLSFGLAGDHKGLTSADRERGSDYFLRECGSRVGHFGVGRWIVPVANFTRGGPETLTPYTVLVAPHWSLALASAVMPAVWLFRWRRHRERPKAGVCRSCGYDLRATPERCPECGRDATGAG